MTRHGTIADLFEKNRYHILRAILTNDQRDALYRFTRDAAASGELQPDRLMPSTPSSYASAETEEILEGLLPLVETVAGVKLFPTYSYFRVYQHGDVLPSHVDRESCEISLSIALGYEAGKPWPFFVKGPTGVCKAELYPGDGLLYRGCECEHWRDRFEGRRASQMFLHYVAQDGPNAAYRFDGRECLTHRETQLA
jgi:hypothetical protein